MRILFSQALSNNSTVDNTLVNSTASISAASQNTTSKKTSEVPNNNESPLAANLNQVSQDLIQSNDDQDKKNKKGLASEFSRFIHSLVIPLSILMTLTVIFSFIAAAKGRHIIGIVLEPLWMDNNFEEATIKSLRSRMPSIFNMKHFPVYFSWGIQAWKLELQGKTTKLLELRLRKKPIKDKLSYDIWSEFLDLFKSLTAKEIEEIQEGRLGLSSINPDPKYNPKPA